MFSNEVLGSVYSALLHGTHREFVRQYSPQIAANVILQFVEKATLPLFRQSWERVLLVEMHFADADGLLQGETEADRFEYFIREVVKPEHFASLLKKYPVLWQRWQGQFATCLESIETLLSRLVADKESVAAQLYGDRTVQKISELTPVGDPHGGMRQTTRVDYLNERDETRIVYYKPRPIGIDAGLAAFFHWWNQHFHLDHQVPAVVERAGYGWAKAIPHQACETKDQVCGYYRRYGSLVALGHLFRTTDLHRENIVACGAYPVIVDCETMFSCTVAAHSPFPGESHLYASCLLPVQRLRESVEVSPLSARSGQETDIEVWVNPQRRTSTAKLEMRKLTTPDCACEVFLGQTPVGDFIDYAGPIIEGMRLTLEFAAENKDAILDKIDECMRGVAVRILFRATATYASALTNSWHPDSLFRGETELDLHKFVDASRDPEILQSELSQMRKGDIPYFRTYFDRPEVADADGQILALQIARTPQQKIRHQFSRLNERFIAESVEDLEYALLTYRLRRGDRNTGAGSRLRALDHLPDAAWLDAAAIVVLDKVLEKALLLEGDCYFWRSMGATEPARLQAGLTSYSLYDGVAGIALAYFTAGTRLRSDRYLHFARTQAGSADCEAARRKPVSRVWRADGNYGHPVGHQLHFQGRLHPALIHP
jgi:type 2 lantibiotic biosynthesis protein LanM